MIESPAPTHFGLSVGASRIFSELFKSASWFGVEEASVTVMRAAGDILESATSKQHRDDLMLSLLVSGSEDRPGLAPLLQAMVVGALEAPALITESPERTAKAEEGFDLPWLHQQAVERVRSLAAQYPDAPLDEVVSTIVLLAGRFIALSYTPKYRDNIHLWVLMEGDTDPDSLPLRLPGALSLVEAAEQLAVEETSSKLPAQKPRQWVSRSKKRSPEKKN